LRHIPPTESIGYYQPTVLVTPGALGGPEPVNEWVSVYVGGSGGAEELSDKVAGAVSPLAWNAEVRVNADAQYRGQGDEEVEMLRNVLMGASLFVLAVAALSLLMLSVEQITERRRPLAALSAAGVPVSVLARASLWQTAVPVLVGVVLAVGRGSASPRRSCASPTCPWCST
jgi:hypothetical protein